MRSLHAARLPSLSRFGVLLFYAGIVLCLIGVFLLPYLWVVASGLKPQASIFSDVTPVGWRTFVPIEPTFEHVQRLFTERGVGRALFNSAIVSFAQVCGTVLICALACYALTRLDLPGRGFLLAMILLTFLVPYEALIVPLYSLVGRLGLQDSLAAVFLPWVASPLGIFMLRPEFEELPRELDDAAKLDGAGHWRIFWSIILPNVRTSLATVALVTFLFSWNAFLWPLVVLQSQDNVVIQVAIAQSVAPGQLPNWGETFAGAALATIPLIIIFLFLQRYFIQGFGLSGTK